MCVCVCVCVCKLNVSLNNRQALRCHETQPTNYSFAQTAVECNKCFSAQCPGYDTVI